MMSDQFLTQFQVQPREAFATDLYRKLAAHKPARAPSMLKRLGLGFAVMCAVMATVLAVSPAARAQVEQLIYNIAGYRIGTDTSSVDPDGIMMSQSALTDLATAEADIGHRIALPTYIPADFVGTPKVTHITTGPWGVNLVWTHKDAAMLAMESKLLGLGIAKDAQIVERNVGKATLSEIKVNGQPAVLAENIWALWTDENGKVTGEMKPTQTKMLMWKAGDLGYSIWAGLNVSVEDMIRMAESVK